MYQNRLTELRKEQPQILAISEYTKQDTMKYLNMPSNKIKVIMAGLNEEKISRDCTKEKIDEVLKKYNIKKPYFLSVGECDGYKNTDLFVASVVKLTVEYGNNQKNDISYFVIVGSMVDSYKKHIRKHCQIKGTKILFSLILFLKKI